MAVLTTTSKAVPEKLKAQIRVIASYPSLLNQEVEVGRTPYDVKAWTSYLEELDHAMEQLEELLQLSGSSNNKHNKEIICAGRAKVRASDADQYHEELVHARLFVAERATHLLPGSYKLWRNHLLFSISRLKQQKRQQQSRSSSSSNGGLAWTTGEYVVSCSPQERRYEYCVRQFEIALRRLHKMPRLWLDYLELVVGYHHPFDKATELRRLYNQALEALPVTQHDKIWKACLSWLHRGIVTTAATTADEVEESKLLLSEETILRLRRRHAHYYDPSAREVLATLCEERLNRPGEAARLYLDVLNDTTFISPNGTSKADLWMKLANLCTRHPDETAAAGIDFETLVRGALNPKPLGWEVMDIEASQEQEGDNQTENKGQVTDKETSANKTKENPLAHLGEMEGTLWTKLADYYIRKGDFDMARSVYEEGMDSVSRVRDFSILFDAYIRLEEGIMEATMEQMNEEIQEDDTAMTENGTGDTEDDWDILVLAYDEEESFPPGLDPNGVNKNNNTLSDMELAMARAEHLTSRRPLLLNRVLLKQNPHNVGEWLTRAELYQKQQHGNVDMACAALEESLKKVHARRAVNGTPAQLVVTLSKLYKTADQTRALFQRICQAMDYAFRDADDLAQCWTAWIEFELKEEEWDTALALARESVAPPDSTIKVPHKRKLVYGLTKSLRLWDLLLDLEESLGTVATAKDTYNRAIDTKVSTPMHILNFATYLKEQNYFEESFTAYERGVEMFQFPAVKVLWKAYMEDFIERYGGAKVERVRDMFARCLETCPPEDDSCAEFFMMNAQYEEEHGLTKRALRVYRSMCSTLPLAQDKFAAYKLYIAKTTKYMGLTATRDIYQEAVQELEDQTLAAKLCLDFVKMEESLQELDRVRAVLAYGAQMADPRRLPEYWTTWHAFEVSHGNEETFREMLRIKRSVQAAFSTVNYNATGMSEEVSTLTDEQAIEMLASQEGVELAAGGSGEGGTTSEASAVQGFVAAKKRPAANLGEMEERVAKLRKATSAAQATEDSGGVTDKSNAAIKDHRDEIDLDDEDEDEDEGVEESDTKTGPIQNVITKVVPAAVFGGLAKDVK